MTEENKRFGKKTIQLPDATKLADDLLTTVAKNVLERGNLESPAAEIPKIEPVEIKNKSKKTTIEPDKLNAGAVELTIPVNFRVPLALHQFIIEMTAKESLNRKCRVTATQIFLAATTEYARKAGYKG